MLKTAVAISRATLRPFWQNLFRCICLPRYRHFGSRPLPKSAGCFFVNLRFASAAMALVFGYCRYHANRLRLTTEMNISRDNN